MTNDERKIKGPKVDGGGGEAREKGQMNRRHFFYEMMIFLLSSTLASFFVVFRVCVHFAGYFHIATIFSIPFRLFANWLPENQATAAAVAAATAATRSHVVERVGLTFSLVPCEHSSQMRSMSRCCCWWCCCLRISAGRFARRVAAVCFAMRASCMIVQRRSLDSPKPLPDVFCLCFPADSSI